jgi:hypothetical protein
MKSNLQAVAKEQHPVVLQKHPHQRVMQVPDDNPGDSYKNNGVQALACTPVFIHYVDA